ncbi:Hypothetical predicted protein [Xyrichtys novacula]|uniref:Uncharacterized protein n=1 Tax=Xyrichtys novacula TaxID=13765 RepID=A0AAV1EPZ3_XYRNO|nr:Hypothetical predicted protein [Xyrichtys novacula]
MAETPSTSTAHQPASCSAFRSAGSPRRSTSTPDGLPVLPPGQLCEEAPHLSEGGSMAASAGSPPQLINSFSAETTRLAPSLQSTQPAAAVPQCSGRAVYIQHDVM